MKVFILTILVALSCRNALAEVYTSTALMENVLETESQVVNILEGFLSIMYDRMDLVRRYIEDYRHLASEQTGITMSPSEQVHHTGEDQDTLAEQVIGNPVQAYQMMRRLTVDWASLEVHLNDDIWQRVLYDIQTRRAAHPMPEENDLRGAAQALIRLKDTYRLNASDISRGNIQGIPSSVGLTARDCLFLGRNSFHVGMVQHAVEFYEQALTLAAIEGNLTTDYNEIKPFLDQAVTEQDLRFAQAESLPRRLQFTSDKVGHSNQQATSEKSFNKDDVDNNFAALCRGEKLLSESQKAQLKCTYSTRGDPYFILQPVKVEHHYTDPEIVTFHNVLSENEVAVIKNAAKPSLKRSQVIRYDGQGSEVSVTRTSQNTWLYDEFIETNSVLKNIMDRISWITGLNVFGPENSEALQVANYGIGGHYVPHHDYIFKDKSPEEMEKIPSRDREHGERIATFMFYLSDVARGGATAFPKLGVSVWPHKGSAAFWYNLRKNTQPDNMTLHGACPVLHGSKWVANKWIHEQTQTFRRPCDIDISK